MWVGAYVDFLNQVKACTLAVQTLPPLAPHDDPGERCV